MSSYDDPDYNTGTTTPDTTTDKPRRTSRRKADPEPQPEAEPQAEEPTEKRPNAFVRFFTDGRLRIFTGLTMLLLSVFMVIAVFSYFSVAGATDQSHAMNQSLGEMAKEPEQIKNFGGAFGAWLSHYLLTEALGIGSLVAIVWLWLIGLTLLRVCRFGFWSTTFKCLLLAVTLSVVAGLVTYDMKSVVFWGGNHGHFANKFLIDHATVLGAWCVSLLLVIAVACVFLNEIVAFWRKCRSLAERHRMQSQLDEQRRRDLEQIADTPEEEAAAEDAATPEETPEEGGVVIAGGEPEEQPEGEEGGDEGSTISFEDVPDETDETDEGEDAETIVIEPAGDIPIDGDETFTIETHEIEKADKIVDNHVVADGDYDHRADLSRFVMPGLDLLEDRPSGQKVDEQEQQENKERIVETLLQYGIKIARITASVGPTVTLYEIVPAEGVRIAQIKRLEDDIALSLSALGIRIIAPIPGKGAVGIEVPNRVAQGVSMFSVIASKKYQESKMELPMAMGTTISNEVFIADLVDMPHILVAGATGMGKSVGLNAIIASLLYRKHPSELKLVMIDPKMVEFSHYEKIERQYLAKLPGEEDAIITDMNKVIATLNSLCVEMDNRYQLLRAAGVVKITDYNRLFTERKLNPEKGHYYMPYIVVVVDEFADLIMTAGKEVEAPIIRIVQKARAVGIHMIIATQRPSTNVLTGVIKANCPGRIAFRVSQMVDSKTILDRPGANQLVGKGDMLFSHNGSLERVQCAFISTAEVKAITEFIADQQGYEHAYYLPEFIPQGGGSGDIAGASMDRDPLFDEAARFVVGRDQGSTSSLQRQFGIGYNRAGKLMDQMEAAGIVGPVCGSKPRAILVDLMTLESMLGNQ